jgi:hypothetical protein
MRTSPTAAGALIIRMAALATAAFVVTAVLAAVSLSTFHGVATAVSLVLFGLGILIFFYAYARAVSRSRFEVISVVGVYFLSGGSAPKTVRVYLLGLVGIQTAVAIATAASRPYTSLAFGILVPLFGIAMCGLWASIHGGFPARPDPADAIDEEADTDDDTQVDTDTDTDRNTLTDTDAAESGLPGTDD